MYHFFLSIFNKKHDLSFLSNVKNTSIPPNWNKPIFAFLSSFVLQKSFYCDFITLIPFIFSTLQIIEKYLPHFYPIIVQTSIKMVWLWYIFWNDYTALTDGKNGQNRKMILIGECIYTRISLTDGKRKDVSHLRKHLFGNRAKFNSQELEFLGMN